MRKILITEDQLKLIVEEETLQNKIVKKIVSYLNTYYEPVMGVIPDDKEYKTSAMIVNLIDETQLTPKALSKYLRHKFGDLNRDFYNQVIYDWFNGNIDSNNLLSKPVKIK